MDLLEYQAKQLFRELGIPVLPAQRIDQPKDLKGLKIPYPVVLKSQVYTGGRGKAGGIKFVENTIDAVAAAHTIFNLPIMGQYPRVLLAEAKYEPEREFYLAIVLDRAVRRPVLLGSQEGGIGVESALDQMQQVVVEQEFSPFYARRLALKMGLQGELIQSVSAIVEKMYQLFVQKDLDLVEINPLAVGIQGELMALDGKVTANNDALGRHPDLLALQAKIPTPKRGSVPSSTLPGLDLVNLDGNIGLLCNGAGLTMATLDLVSELGGKTASFLDLGGEYSHRWPPTTLPERIDKGLELMAQDKTVKVILLNIVENVTSCAQIAAAIAKYSQRQAPSRRAPRLVVRLLGTHLQEAKDGLAEVDVLLFEDVDLAIARAVALAR